MAPGGTSGRRAGRVAALVAVALVAGVVVWLLTRGEDGGSGGAGGAEVAEVTLPEGAVPYEQPVSLVTPAGVAEGEERPLLVFLHGRGGTNETSLGEPMFDALEELGDRAPIVAFPDGGNDSYWHDRASGDWGRFVVEDVIPAAIEETGADPDRIAIGGISMGGFGALDIARLNPGEFCAAGGHSPAIFATAAETAAGAFEDSADFDRHDLVTAALDDPAGLDGPELWIDVGRSDPFAPAASALADNLEASDIKVADRVWEGGHDAAYWDAHWDEYLGFYARALERC